MRNGKTLLPVLIPRFDERHYLEVSAPGQDAVNSGRSASALDHYLQQGIDEDSYTLIRREPVILNGAVERFLVSESGFCLLLGWLADEGSARPRFKLSGGEFSVDLPGSHVFRHARPDVEQAVKSGAYDYGFVIFGRSPSGSLLKRSLLFQANALSGFFQVKITAEIMSDKRLMDTLLRMMATFQSHSGKEYTMATFLGGPAGDTLVELFQLHVASAIANPYVERFRPRKGNSTFVTALFGSADPIMLQPILFRSAGISFGEWIYICNSPEDGATVLRYARQISDLYDISITVAVLADNAGFGAANNVAIERSTSDRIFMVNPDVYPMDSYAPQLQQVLSHADLATTLWGGLLFYDDHNLMHSGMHVDFDSFNRRNALNATGQVSAEPAVCRLLRVEHFDKGVPFEEELWTAPKDVSAITGAVMAFNKRHFSSLGGFSTDYIYGHYEDADLSMRWRETVGPVAIHPQIRLVHLEGQGARARGDEFRGAAMVNRCLFTKRYANLLLEGKAS